MFQAYGGDIAAGRSVDDCYPDGKSLYEKANYTVRFIGHQWRLIRMLSWEQLFVLKVWEVMTISALIKDPQVDIASSNNRVSVRKQSGRM